MASQKGPVATEAPFIAPTAPPAVAAAPLVSNEIFAPEAPRSSSLKRPREDILASPVTATSGQVNSELSPVSKIQRLNFLASKPSPAPPLTGAAAEEEERRLKAKEAARAAEASDNPSHRVLAALMSATNMISRAGDSPGAAPASAAPAAGSPAAALEADNNSSSNNNNNNDSNGKSAPSPAAVPVAQAPPQLAAEHGEGTSPHSAVSGPSVGNSYQVVHSPAPMDVDQRNDHQGSFVAQSETPTEEKNTAYSYPGMTAPTAPMAAPAALQRGMSLPMTTTSATGQHPELAPRSPSSKKHKCPYCDTEFTRHHNLKSHLLTHSQEKPYVCQTCQMRFRRLHDLKRHSKLHTGEKPHICPKCNRKFARGDALARHAKGAGGCAVRRASEGSFGGDDYDESMHEGDDTTMSGMYDGNDTELTEEERRRLSLPTIRAHNVAAPEGFGHTHARTFPQAGPRQGAAGGLYSPSDPIAELVRLSQDWRQSPGAAMPTAVSSHGLPAIEEESATQPASGGGGDGGGGEQQWLPYSPGITHASASPISTGSSYLSNRKGITSPKPLSPGTALATQLGHDHGNRQRSPSMTTQAHQLYGRRQSDLASPHATVPPAPASATNAPAPAGAPGSTATTANHNQSGGAQPRASNASVAVADNSANLFASGDGGIWAYIHTIDSKWEAANKTLQDHIVALEGAKAESDAQIGYLSERVNQLVEESSFLRQQLSMLRGDMADSRRGGGGGEPEAAEAPAPEQRQPSAAAVAAAAAAAAAIAVAEKA